MMREQKVVVDLAFRGPRGTSINDAPPGLQAEDLAAYSAPLELREEAVQLLQSLGFALVGPATPYGVSVIGEAARVVAVFGSDPLTVPAQLAPYFASARIAPPGEFFGQG